jgi:excisionase family DNA binding protein
MVTQMFQHPTPRYTVSQLLALLSTSRATLYAAIRRGELTAHKIGKRTYFLSTAVDDYLALTSSPDYQAGKRGERNSSAQ